MDPDMIYVYVVAFIELIVSVIVMYLKCSKIFNLNSYKEFKCG